MASRISQMRNEMQQQLPYPQTQQGQLSQSIAQVRELMQQLKTMPNKEAALAQILQNNPNASIITNLLSSYNNSNNLELIARQMAQSKGYNINQIINELQGGM